MTTWIGLLALLLCYLVGMSVEQQVSCNSSATASIGIGFGVFPTEISGTIGLPLTLMCMVRIPSADDTIDAYTWEYNRQIDMVSTTEDRSFQPLTSAHGGEYRCRAAVTINKVTTCRTDYSRSVFINTRPTISSISPASAANVVEGESLQLTCEADGYPTPTYEWYRSDAPNTILSTDAVYTLQAVTTSNTGVYICRATNSQGSDSQRNVSVTVIPPPPPTTEPLTNEPMTTSTSPTTEDSTRNTTQEGTQLVPSSTPFYIGIAVVVVVSVAFALLTTLFFFLWLCLPKHKAEPDQQFGSENELVKDDEADEAVDVEAAVFEETVQQQEVIPQPKKKKTRGKRRKF